MGLPMLASAIAPEGCFSGSMTGELQRMRDVRLSARHSALLDLPDQGHQTKRSYALPALLLKDGKLEI